MNIISAHGHSSNHRKEIVSSQKVGCFYCLEIFYPKEIQDWTDDNQTAICPYCGIDSVIGDNSGVELSKKFLNKMKKFWF